MRLLNSESNTHIYGWRTLFSLLALTFICTIIFGALLMLILQKTTGFSLSETIRNIRDVSRPELYFMKFSILINHLGTFILPTVLLTFLLRQKFGSFYKLHKPIDLSLLLLSTGVILFSFPLVQYLFEINQLVELPDYLKSMESQTEELMKAFLGNMSFGDLLFNLFLIAVIPAIGEELFFRGVLQNVAIHLTSKPWFGIIIASIVFSAFHMQFEGFLPRVFLGFVLGALYYMTNNLWYAIIVHFINNGLQVTLLYFAPEMSEDINSPIGVSWIAAAISLIIIIFLLIRIGKITNITYYSKEDGNRL